MKKKLRITRHSPAYWHVSFDNPPLNLIDPDILHELQDLINQFEAANELKVVVFDSTNPEFYIAHVDIIRGGGRDPTDVGPTGLRLLPDFMQRLSRLPIISIASIRGRARGIGAEFVEGLDIRFGSREKMILGQPEVGAALIPGAGGSVYLPLLVGRARALEIIASSDEYTPTLQNVMDGSTEQFLMLNWMTLLTGLPVGLHPLKRKHSQKQETSQPIISPSRRC